MSGPEALMTDIALMQYTGLKDKNGREIYEGDIIREHAIDEDGQHLISSVVFFDGAFCTDDGEYLYDAIMSLDRDENHSEIIGNIYENPDLISV
jgi:uncharacterized phage protein (TIGR01671 family)